MSGILGYGKPFVWGYTQNLEPVTDIEVYTELLRDIETRRVGWDHVGPVLVMTTHMVTDHNHLHPGSPPVTFETYVTCERSCPPEIAEVWEGFIARYVTRPYAAAADLERHTHPQEDA